jgi:hypothetical protein
MTKQIIIPVILFFLVFSSCRNEKSGEKAAEKKNEEPIEILIPESYELANIILAMTEYGLNDPQEIHKGTRYYDEMVKYFTPYKDHPLLKKVNYSRELWEDLLSFRTDAAAFSFDASGNLKRDYDFFSNEGHKPLDDNLALVNDFARVSKFREFYKGHEKFYHDLVSRYSSYYMLAEMRQFLDSVAGVQAHSASDVKYRIILSPFIGRMQCHRELDSLTTADFPDISHELMENSDSINKKSQAADIHTVFTEMDHGYVNPISDKYAETLAKKFDYKKWDKNSGYEEINCFNEYMTWALYDLFLKRYFPQYEEEISVEWHYQNSTRGFFASSFFADKLKELAPQIKSGKTLDALYPQMLNWCEKVQSSLSQPLLTMKEDSAYKYIPGKPIKIIFSEPMKKDFEKMSIYIGKLNDGKNAKEGELLTLNSKDVKWEGNTMLLSRDIKYPEFYILFNWWGLPYPVLSEKEIMLKPQASAWMMAKK